MISYFEHLKSTAVHKEMDVYEFVEAIRNPEPDVKKSIEKARSYYSSSKDTYSKLKAELPCFGLNFMFKKLRRKDDIIGSTGLIYLDVDGSTDIDLDNPYVFASWLSVSRNGRGILVRVEGLTIENFSDTYSAIAIQLNIDVDRRAGKPTQPTLHSYDKDIYFNEDANTWVCDYESYSKDTPKTPLLEKKKRDCNDEMGRNLKLRFNNYDEVDFNGKEYLYFKREKKLMASVVIPLKIKAGNRNSIISSITYQIRALNPEITLSHLKGVVEGINNSCCKPRLRALEVSSIVQSVMEREVTDLILNSPRRFLFNPSANLTRKQKMKIICPLIGKARTEKTKEEIAKCIAEWDVTTQGSISQNKLKDATGKSIGTIEKYYKCFKPEIADIKERFKQLKTG